MAIVETVLIKAEEPLTAVRTSWSRQLLRRLITNPSAVVGMVLMGVIVLAAILAPLIARANPDAINISALNLEPSRLHPFGTDYLGRDMWSRVIWGSRVSMPAGLGVILISFGAGTPMGLIAGYMGGVVEEIVMRFVDLLLAIPSIMLAILIVAILGPSLQSAVIGVGIANIPGFARIARGSTLATREREYVASARALGAGNISILFRHIMPNVIDPLVVLATISLGYAILATAALSYLGIGTQVPTSDWGTMLSSGYEHMHQSWSEVTFPGLAIVVAVLGINLLGDGLGDALNPRLKGGK